jgi:asparagine synthase (glutamine-hydrolysing)
MDSSTMLHYAAEASSKPIKTFSVAFPGRSFDEKTYIDKTSAAYNTEHHELGLCPSDDLADEIESLAYYSDEPSADAGALPVWFLSALTRKHVTVALSGEGADELFAGYQTYKADRYGSFMRPLPRSSRLLLARFAEQWPASDEKVSFGYKLKRFTKGSLLSPDEAHCYWNGSFDDRERRALTRLQGYTHVSDLFSGIEGKGLNRYLQFDTRYYLADDILYKSDRMSMARSLEVRTPFLDHRIMEFAAGLPERYKLNGAMSKFVLKRLMAGKLPKHILRRPKQGLDIPTHDWFRSALRPLLLDTLSEAALERAGIFESSAVQRLVRAHLERRCDAGYQLWGLLFLVLWARQWNIDLSAAAVPEMVTQGAFAD